MNTKSAAAAVAEWHDVHSIEVRGTTLTYREAGSGEPVVMVHGGLSDMRTWAPQLAGLSDQFRVISLSRRYARPNADIPDGVDDQIGDHAADLIGFIEGLGSGPVHLLGNSWGAFICLVTAIRRPDLVRSLALEEPPVLPLVIGAGARPQAGRVVRSLIRHPRRTMWILKFGATGIVSATKAFQRGDLEAGWQQFVEGGPLGAGALQRFPAERLQQMRENATALRAQFLGAGFPELRPSDVRALGMPILLVEGADSPRALRALVATLAELLPGAERVVIPKATHIMHEENPEALNAAMRAFLTAQSFSSSSR